MLGYVARGLTLDRKGGAIRTAGTVKASWLSGTLGLSQRAVRYAQSRLKQLGWICPDRGSKQWKLNRTGAWFCIRLDWVPTVAPLPVEISTPAASPKEDRKTPTEIKDQKLVVFERRGGEPTLRNIQLGDLQDRGRLRVLFRQAVARGWVRSCEADALNFLAAAVRARSTPSRDPVRVFVSLVRERRWNHITQAQEDQARRTLRESSKRPPSSVRAIGDVLKTLLPASLREQTAQPHLTGPNPASARYFAAVLPSQCEDLKGHP
jgi:hypothetical protein